MSRRWAKPPYKPSVMLWAGAACVGAAVLAALVVAAGNVRAHFGPATPPPVAAAAGLVCDTPAYDFGPVGRSAAATLRHEFVLTNTGDCPVSILKHATSCNCTVPAIPTEPVAPGASIRIPVKADFSDRAGPHSTSILLATSDAHNPQLRLTLRALTKVPAVLSQESIDFGPVRLGERQARVVRLDQGTDERPFRVLKVTASDPRIEVRRAPLPGQTAAALEGGPGDFVVSVAAPPGGGGADLAPVRADVTFLTDLADEPERKLTVSAVPRTSITAAPTAVLFPADSSGAEVVGTVRVATDRAGADVRAELVWESDGPNPFSIRDRHAVPGKGGSAVDLAVVCARPADDRLRRGVLRITVGDEYADVPVVAIGRRAAGRQP